MRFALALALFVCGSATNCLATDVLPGEASRDDKPTPTRIGDREAEARQLLGAANVVGGLWRASVDRNNRRGLELLAWGTRIMQGGGDAIGERARGDAGRRQDVGDALVHLVGVRGSVRDRTGDAALSIRSGQADAAVALLQTILDDIDEPNAQELARTNTLLALAHLGKEDLEVAVQAMDSAVGVACSVICAPEIRPDAAAADAHERPVARHKIQFAVYQVLLASQHQLETGRADRVIRALTRMVRDERVSPTAYKELRPAGGLRQSRRIRTTRLTSPDLVALQLALARAHKVQDNIGAAIAAYEGALALDGGIWQLDITRENLATLHFDHGDFERSLGYQRAWLRNADWVERACPVVCPPLEP